MIARQSSLSTLLYAARALLAALPPVTRCESCPDGIQSPALYTITAYPGFYCRPCALRALEYRCAREEQAFARYGLDYVDDPTEMVARFRAETPTPDPLRVAQVDLEALVSSIEATATGGPRTCDHAPVYRQWAAAVALRREVHDTVCPTCGLTVPAAGRGDR